MLTDFLYDAFFLRYLYGFEEYCTSASIEFQMALPEKIASKDYETSVKKHEEREQNVKEIKVDIEEREDELAMMRQQVKSTENERKANEKPGSLVRTVECFSCFIKMVQG